MSAPYIPNRNATAARMAGGPQGAKVPIFSRPVAATAGAGTTPYGDGSLGMESIYKPQRYDPYQIARSQYDNTRKRQNYQQGREVGANDAYDAALGDPTGQAQMFQGFYGDATQAMAAPILRQFQMALANNVGAQASRFGGQGGSTEQAKGEFNTGDVFSRNLAEIIRANAGASVNAGMDFTNMLGQRAQSAQGAVDNTTQLAGQFGQSTKKPKSGVGSFIGGALGAAGGALIGNPGFGAAVGGKIFGK
jgi:hypothetical protein